MRYFLPILLLLTLFSCNKKKELQDKAEDYIKKHLKKPDSYKLIKLSDVDTTVSSEFKYTVTDAFEVENANSDKVSLHVSVHFDSSLNIVNTSPKLFNGDYGSLAGNVYWKYNNYVGNKPDVGSEIALYSLDSLRADSIYETTCDVSGNFNLKKILPGYYLLVVSSKNTTAPSDETLTYLLHNSPFIDRLWHYDIEAKNKDHISKYAYYDSLFTKTLYGKAEDYGGLSKQIATYNSYQEQSRLEAAKVINSIPANITNKLKIYNSTVSKKMKMEFVIIDENEEKTENVDFGITYL